MTASLRLRLTIRQEPGEPEPPYPVWMPPNRPERPAGCGHYWRGDVPCQSCEAERVYNARKEPCHYCGSTAGYSDQGDGAMRCDACHGD